MSKLLSSSTSIAIGGISHETHSFSESLTTMADFERHALLSGGALLDHARGADSVLGGIIDATPRDITLIPTLFASAMPAGPVEPETWTSLSHRLLTRLRTHAIRELGVDGVILVLHGAMTTVEDDDPDGRLVEAVRAIVGGAAPIVVVLDSHANPSQRLVTESDAMVSYRTYPHVDTHATGASALSLCRALIRGDLRPTTALRRLPMLLPLTTQRTNAPTPMARMMRQVSALTRLPGVVQANLMPGFPFADVPHAGVTITVTTDNDRDLAEFIASRFAEGAWQVMRTLTSTATPVDALSPPLTQASGKPIVYADISDNPGAGAPSDHTGLLRHAMNEYWTNGVIATICDQDAVAAAHQAGTGAELAIGIGGKLSGVSSDPVDAPWTVTAVTEGVVRNSGPIGRGGISRFGGTAALRHRGITVIVTEHRQQVLDPSILQAHQIDLANLRWLGVKSSVHFRAAFEPLSASIIEVDSGGLSTEDFTQFDYHLVPRPIFPLDSLDAVNRARKRMTGVGLHV